MRLIECRQLVASDTGAYGTIQATLGHIINDERYYIWLAHGKLTAWQEIQTNAMSVAELRLLAEENGRQLIDLAAIADILPSIVKAVEGDEPWFMPIGSVIPVGIILTQAIVHAVEHRTNVTTILAKLGVKHSDLSAWNLL